MLLKFNLEPETEPEPEQGQSDDSGPSQMPRLHGRLRLQNPTYSSAQYTLSTTGLQTAPKLGAENPYTAQCA